VVFVLGGFSQLRCELKFLIPIEYQVRCVRGLELLRDQIFHDEHVIKLHTRDPARAFPLDLKLEHTTLALFHDKHLVSHLEVLPPHVRLVVMILNSSLAMTRSFLRHLCVDLGHNLDSYSTSISFCALIKFMGALTGTLFFNSSASGVISACLVNTCIGVLLLSLVKKALFRSL
jgi:hypothetical protein